MTPGSFDLATAREITGDGVSRTIEAKARSDADAGVFDPPEVSGGAYWDCVQKQMMFVVYREQFTKRALRNLRFP